MHRSIFVSSTFRDMHLERDAIHMKIIPALNAEAKKWGDSVSACDLRWGIDTSDMEDTDSSKKVLNVCLGEIDRCRPYMIVLLGYRYGWIPGEELISQTIAEKGGFTLDEKEISVTALEIEYGVLSHLENSSRTLFYFREINGSCSDVFRAEDEFHRQKLEALKDRIRQIPEAHIKTYQLDLSALEQSMLAFSRMVYSDLFSLMQEEWRANSTLDRYAIDQKRQWEYLEEKNAQFLSREVLLRECCSVLTDQGENLLIYGKTGSGKSTLISRMGKNLFLEGADVVPIFCGYTNLTSTGFDIVQYIVYELERRLGEKNHFEETDDEKNTDQNAWLTYFVKLFETYSASGGKRLVFLIDGIDQLVQDDIAENCAFIPEDCFPNISFALSMVTSDHMPLKLQVEIADLTEEEKKCVIAGILHGRHKELSDPVIRKITELPNARLPLYLSLIIHRLIMMDYNDFEKITEKGEGMEAITNYHLQLIDECPDSLEELSAYILSQASGQIGGEPIRLMSFFLAVSRHGLRFSDLERLVNALRTENGRRMQLNMVDAAGFLQYSSSFFFTRNDGRIDFSHKCFRLGMQKRMPDMVPLHGLIASWLQHLPQSDEVRSQELCWHLIQADAMDMLADLQLKENDNQPLRVAMARDLAQAAIKDCGEWLRRGLYTIADKPSFLSFSGFVSSDVFFQLPDNKNGWKICSSLVLAILDIEKKKLEKKESYPLQWELSVNYERLSSIEKKFGTDDHTKKSREYARKCLEIRRKLLESLKGLDTTEKQLEYLVSSMEENGQRLKGKPSPQQLQGVIQAMCMEVLRGVCVANELSARALHSDYPNTAAEALPYLEESLSIRTQIYNRSKEQESNISFLLADEEYELAHIHLEIAEACECLKDECHLDKAEIHIGEAIRISEEIVLKDPSAAHVIILSQSCRMMARYIQVHRLKNIAEAISLARKSQYIMESAYRGSRAAAEQYELSQVYRLIGDLYSEIGDDESLAAAHGYYAKMNKLASGLLFKTESVEVKKAFVEAGIMDAESAGSMSIAEIKEHFREMYRQANELFLSFRNEESYHHLEKVYTALIHVIESSDLGKKKIGRRAAIEVRCAYLDRAMEIDNITIRMLLQCVVEYNELNQQIQELNLPDDEVWPEDWIEMLECVEIPKEVFTIIPARRAYELSGKSCELSRRICSMDNSTENLDTLAVSLSKFLQICMQVDLKEFARVNHEFMALAHELYDKTGKERYVMMLLQAQMGEHLVEGTMSEFLDVLGVGNRGKTKPGNEKTAPAETAERNTVTEKEIRDSFRSLKSREETEKTASRDLQKAMLEEKICELEHQIDSATGPFAAFRRNKLKKELEELREKLRGLD